jgi:hypothetical protein
MTKASTHGLGFRQDVGIDDGAIMAPVEDSFADFLKGTYQLWELGRRNYRPIGRDPQTAGDYVIHMINETIDGSAFDRWRGDASYRPKNLADWAARRGVNIEDLHGSKQAADPSQAAPD